MFIVPGTYFGYILDKFDVFFVPGTYLGYFLDKFDVFIVPGTYLGYILDMFDVSFNSDVKLELKYMYHMSSPPHYHTDDDNQEQ